MINDMRRLPAEERDQGKESIHHRSASRKRPVAEREREIIQASANDRSFIIRAWIRYIQRSERAEDVSMKRTNSTLSMPVCSRHRPSHDD